MNALFERWEALADEAPGCYDDYPPRTQWETGRLVGAERDGLLARLRGERFWPRYEEAGTLEGSCCEEDITADGGVWLLGVYRAFDGDRSLMQRRMGGGHASCLCIMSDLLPYESRDIDVETAVIGVAAYERNSPSIYESAGKYTQGWSTYVAKEGETPKKVTPFASLPSLPAHHLNAQRLAYVQVAGLVGCSVERIISLNRGRTSFSRMNSGSELLERTVLVLPDPSEPHVLSRQTSLTVTCDECFDEEVHRSLGCKVGRPRPITLAPLP